jgi:hypothetical protein
MLRLMTSSNIVQHKEDSNNITSLYPVSGCVMHNQATSRCAKLRHAALGNFAHCCATSDYTESFSITLLQVVLHRSKWHYTAKCSAAPHQVVHRKRRGSTCRIMIRYIVHMLEAIDWAATQTATQIAIHAEGREVCRRRMFVGNTLIRSPDHHPNCDTHQRRNIGACLQAADRATTQITTLIR